MTGQTPLRVAVIGAGHLGKFHARVYSKIPSVKLAYVIDTDPSHAEAVAAECTAKPLSDYRPILKEVDAVSIVTPTTSHFEIARAFLDAGVSVLLEKPMTATVEQADELIRLASASKSVLQIGHIERFNPAYAAIRDFLKDPVFIECHRLGPYSFRSTDVSVVLDLMIHDLDLILDIAGVPVAVEAAGTPIVSTETDIANARIRFNTPDGRPGCVANVSASRISAKPMRRLRVFQRDAYISMDFLEKKVYVFRKRDGFDLAQAQAALAGLPREHVLGQLVDIRQMDFAQSDVLHSEISAFVSAVKNRTMPVVTGEHGRRALALAVAIDQEIHRFISDRK